MKAKAKPQVPAKPDEDEVRPQLIQKRGEPSQSKIEICILAGGLGSRMGRDKSKLRLGRKTFLSHIRSVAQTLGFPVRVIRRDLVPRCGPLGGIFTALHTTSADAVLFLACDMPKVSSTLLGRLVKCQQRHDASVFTSKNGIDGFPFLITRSALSIVEQLIVQKNYSLQNLSLKIQAKKFRAGNSELININTPDDLKELKSSLKNA